MESKGLALDNFDHIMLRTQRLYMLHTTIMENLCQHDQTNSASVWTHDSSLLDIACAMSETLLGKGYEEECFRQIQEGEV